jgi:hypothetical protein
VSDGQKPRVEIATEWDTAAGIGGLIEKILYPPRMRRIYEK